MSKTKANAEARAAYEAGVRETMLKLQQVRGPTVIVSGPVKNTMIPWTPELTLARAILSAGYLAPKDPSHISIIRNSEQIPVDPKSLLAGDDVPLASGDIIKIEP